jgi:DNA-binding transcriptional MerR regulator
MHETEDTIEETELLLAGDVAALAGISTSLVKRCTLRPLARTPGGVRLYNRADVAAWVAQRRARRRLARAIEGGA